MSPRKIYDAIVVGSGPNGFAAAITLAQAGYSVQLREAKPTIGGGMRSAELTLPGFLHDVCSAIHPLGMGSPFFRTLPLDEHGLRWIQPKNPAAHPLPDGSAVLLDQSIEVTADNLGRDAAAYRALMEPLVHDWPKLSREFLGPLRFPRHPIAMTRFGLLAMQPVNLLAHLAFRGERARALLAGLGAHSIMSLYRSPTAAFALMLGILAHVAGWPLPEGGSQSMSNALASYLHSLGGEIITDAPVESLDELSGACTVLLDITVAQFLQLAGNRLPSAYRWLLSRYRYGPAVFKVDFALDGPIPWRAQECLGAGTVHVGGTLREIAEAEHTVWKGRNSERPFVMVAQQSLFDPSRAPAGKQTVWSYCHVPNGSTEDVTERIEAQIERFAPGFRDRILARNTISPMEFQRYNPNYVGGDINGGVQDLLQLFTRPTFQLNPYATPLDGVYLCSSSTPPGGGVHGMCGYFAARSAIRDTLRGSVPSLD
jgi:phytoene dehydrogenase-like protein